MSKTTRKFSVLIMISCCATIFSLNAQENQKRDTDHKHDDHRYVNPQAKELRFQKHNRNIRSDVTKSWYDAKKAYQQTYRSSRGFGHWAGVGLHYNGLVSSLGDFSLPADGEFLSQEAKSLGVTVNLFDYAIVNQRKWGLITGLGFEFNNFNFDRNMTLASADNRVVPDYRFATEGVTLEKTKLVTSYLNIPLLFELKLGSYNRGFINAGVIGGLRLQSHTKIKGDLQGDNIKKVKNKQHIHNFHYGIAVGGGFSHIGITATYYPGSLFRKDQGPDVEQINIGLALFL